MSANPLGLAALPAGNPGIWSASPIQIHGSPSKKPRCLGGKPHSDPWVSSKAPRQLDASAIQILR